MDPSTLYGTNTYSNFAHYSKNVVQQVHTSKALLIIAVIMILAVYLRYYTKAPLEVSVLQIRASAFRPEMLMEKQPIVIEDRVVDSRQLARHALKYYTVYSSFRPSLLLTQNAEVRTYAAATLVSPKHRVYPPGNRRSGEDRFLLRARPLKKSDPKKSSNNVIDFYLRVHQVLVLPTHWAVSLSPLDEGSRAGTRKKDDLPSSISCSMCEAFDLVHLVFLPFACLVS